MTTEELYEMMGEGNLGYACVYKREDHGRHTDFLFPMTPKNIANFIGQNAFSADKIIMTDFCAVEMDTDFMLRVMKYIKVYENGQLVVAFLDGTEIECK